MLNLEKEASDLQVELFGLLAEFFGRATGIPPQEFATVENFSDQIRKQASLLGYRGEDAYSWADKELRSFYAKKGATIFRVASRLGGLKLVLGGSSRFMGSQLSAVNGSLLYADTIAIPDPVLPWLETERKEEKFRHVLMLQAVHALLHLKPVVDAELAHCPVLVFPSWEKMLEKNDPTTIERLEQLFVDFAAKYIDASTATMDDVKNVVLTQPEQFLQAVERSKVFIPPGGQVGESIADALVRYEKNLETWRSKEWLTEFGKLSTAAKVMNALFERITPQYHLLENSEELKAHPLICISQQAYYFRLLSDVNSARLERIGLLDKQTQAIISGLSSERLAWLSNVPIEATVELRNNNENEAFRKLLGNAVSRLHDASIENTDSVAAEICRDIDSGIADHNRILRERRSEFVGRMVKWTGAAGVAGLAALVPSLAPYLGAALPLALAGKVGWDVRERSTEKKKQSRSLMGVLAVARAGE
jgi:hypothetical protein